MSKELRYQWQQFVKRLRKKGNERLTFMIIPHNQSNIFNVQLSKFNIFVTVVAFTFIVFSSVLASKIQLNMKGEVNELHDVNRAVYSERDQYVSSYLALWKEQMQIRDELSNIMRITELEPDLEKRFYKDSELYDQARLILENEVNALKAENQSEISENTTMQILTALGQSLSSSSEVVIKYDDMVINYKKLHLELKQNIQVAREVYQFLRERETVQQNLPYYWPMGGGHFTSFYGPRLSPFGYSRDYHTGIDLADEVGTPIYAAGEGNVVIGGYYGGYGITAKIQHRYGFVTLYAHMSTIYVRPGQNVKKGQMIGRVGATGRVTGPHLHYEIRIYDKPIDPLPYLTSG